MKTLAQLKLDNKFPKKAEPAMGGGGKKPPKKPKIGTGGNDDRYNRGPKDYEQNIGGPRKVTKDDKHKKARMPKGTPQELPRSKKEPKDIPGKKPNDYKSPDIKSTKSKDKQFPKDISNEKKDKDRSPKYNKKDK